MPPVLPSSGKKARDFFQVMDRKIFLQQAFSLEIFFPFSHEMIKRDVISRVERILCVWVCERGREIVCAKEKESVCICEGSERKRDCRICV